MAGSVLPTSRLLALADIRSASDCWVWRGATKGNGYGNFQIGGRYTPAHRAAYAMLVAPVADGLDVCHRCDNRACINPSHLFLGTRADNMQDCKAKGRTARGAMLPDRKGDNSPAAKLTWDDVKAIRASARPSKHLAVRYGVGADNINRIRRNETWKEQNNG